MQNLKPKLDQKDKKIMSLIHNSPEIAQNEIADKVKLSQPSVALRLKRLKKYGFVEEIVGMNLSKLGLCIAKVDITTRDPVKIINAFKNCPFFLNGLITSGVNNLCLLFVSENVATLEAIVDFHLRAFSEVQSVNFNCVISSAIDLVMPVKANTELMHGKPCGEGITCEACTYYKENKCLGCPARGMYRGKIW